MLRAVLFDLDDTLFDHRLCARTALAELHAAHEALRARPFGDVERLHAGFLEDLHRRVMTGELALEDARRERFRRLFRSAGMPAGDAVVDAAAAAYRDSYRRVRQSVRGAAALLERVRRDAAVAIVSNNLLEEQEDKLRHCGLDRFVDVLVVSEGTGYCKPDPELFALALGRLDCRARDAIMVGDSWAADIVGARAAGIPSLWFNPGGEPPPEPGAGVPELRSLEPTETAFARILDAHSRYGAAVRARRA